MARVKGGGFGKRTSCGEFIRNHLMTTGGEPIVDICNAYKAQLRKDQISTQAKVLANKELLRIKKAGKSVRFTQDQIDRGLAPDEALTEKYIAKLEIKYPHARRYGPTYNSFATYISKLKLLGWVTTSDTFPSLAQDRVGESPVNEKGNKTRREAFPRTIYEITPLGRSIDPAIWRNPMIVRHPEYTNKTERYRK